MTDGPTPLAGLRVLDRSSEIAGPYCTRLLAGVGADVVKVESAAGDPLRRWRSGALFDFLNQSKRSVTGDDDLLAAADVVVTERADHVAAARDANPGAVVVSITPFGTTGPWTDRPATEFTLQAWCGSTGGRGFPEVGPVAAGGRLGEWVTGTYAAVGALAARRVAAATGRGVHVDVAMLECMAVAMTTYPSVFAELLGWPDMPISPRSIEVPSIEPTRDGWVGITTNSGQQFEDLLTLIGRPDWIGDRHLSNPQIRFHKRHDFLEAVHAFTTPRTTAEVLEEAALLRIPTAPVLNGETVTAFEQLAARGVFEPAPGGRFVQPRLPFRISATSSPAWAPAPAIGADDGAVSWDRRPAPATSDEPAPLPLAGVRVLDCTAWWAGPAATHGLACLGADVVKVESTTRPDLMRYTSVKPPSVDQWWDWGPLFHSVNNTKRGITLDLTRAEGIDAFLALAREADVVVENYTPRVMDHFGLTWERLHEVNPALVMVRMPAFGLDGPWRDRTGFAQTTECLSGMAWVTGDPDGPPVLPRGACDPLGGMHAVFATLAALAARDGDGVGRHVEAVLVEAALNAAAEQVVEHGATGTVLTREGNRGAGAVPQGVYRCAGDDDWVAVAIRTDDEWLALRRVIGDPDWAAHPSLASADGRRAAHDSVDAALADWFASAPVDDAVDALLAVGVPAAVVISPRDLARNEQLRARGLLEREDHPVTGPIELPVLPIRMSGVDRWLRSPSPTLGQHNDDVLGPVVGPEHLEALRAAGVVGDRPVGA